MKIKTLLSVLFLAMGVAYGMQYKKSEEEKMRRVAGELEDRLNRLIKTADRKIEFKNGPATVIKALVLDFKESCKDSPYYSEVLENLKKRIQFIPDLLRRKYEKKEIKMMPYAKLSLISYCIGFTGIGLGIADWTGGTTLTTSLCTKKGLCGGCLVFLSYWLFRDDRNYYYQKVAEIANINQVIKDYEEHRPNLEKLFLVESELNN